MTTAGDLLVGRYRILHKVRQGGMGTVFRARDEQGDRDVALKELHSDSRLTGYLKQKFAQEAAILQQLSHPLIPRVLDYFLEGDGYFMAMEFIEGENLRELAKDNPVAQETVVDYAIQVCGILRYLHEQEPPMLHRDVKPDNLILCPQRSGLVLVDFGLARDFDKDSQVTRTEAGTVGYASREQVKGHPEPRSDIYGLGATMHFLLTGRAPAPFKMSSPQRTHPHLRPKLNAIVEKATEQQAADRFASAAEMEEALRQVWNEDPPEPPPQAATVPSEPVQIPPPPSPSRLPWLAAAFAGAVLAAAAWWLTHHGLR